MLSSEALSQEIEDSSVIEDSVERTQQRVFFMEILTPERGIAVAREDDVVCALLVVASVNHVEEEPGVFFVEVTTPNLINDDTGRPHEIRDCSHRFLHPPSVGELVPQLRRLYEICLQTVFAAFVSERLRQMRLTRSGRTDERDIPMRIDGSECKAISSKRLVQARYYSILDRYKPLYLCG